MSQLVKMTQNYRNEDPTKEDDPKKEDEPKN